MKTYTSISRLGTGASRLRVAMRHRLYSGPDHLLLVQSTGFGEDYRRIYYRDIRYVVVRKDNRNGLMNILFSLPIIACFLFLIAHFSWIPLAVVSGIFAGLIVINLLLGPTCQCRIVTNVQALEVPTPSRINKVPVLINFLRTKVPELQGEPVVT